uniref:Capsid protein n=1 Tax=Sugarcane striate virus TaxID=1868659 RepID=A0A218KH42_9GEMI|nr:capsid protein [Sugarcane striate virus]ANO40469.1 capsid protein [Sugarcane striate virus]
MSSRGPSRKRPRSSTRVVQWPSEALRKGYTPRNSYLRGTRSGRSDKRPNLQVQTFYACGPTQVQVRKGGIVNLLNGYTRGSDDNQRHTCETITYKLSLDLHLNIATELFKNCARGTAVIWLIYDTSPSSTQLTTQQIFAYPDALSLYPYTWKVARDQCHRFVIKRRWTVRLESNGTLGSSDYSSKPIAPCNNNVYFSKFVKRLGVRTEWKNTTGGDAGDMKSGGLFLAFAAGNGMSFNVDGTTRLYFKSTGNQ